jgi:hypothetical protein
MDEHLNAEEREVVKLIGFFKKRAAWLISENKLDENYNQLVETCDKFVEQLNLHANKREAIWQNRDTLKGLIKDNAKCPKCESNENLKHIGTDKSDKGLWSNKYKCRKCNIEFVWNAPNNPGDMVIYIEAIITEMEQKLVEEPMDDNSRAHLEQALAQTRDNLAKFKPIVVAAQEDLDELELRDKEMAELVNKFRKHLLIEKIKMEN